jgi:hypothetical protein
MIFPSTESSLFVQDKVTEPSSIDSTKFEGFGKIVVANTS